MSATVEINWRVWDRSSTVSQYQGLDGWIDSGERLALTSVADEVRGGPILDIGVGGGRTTGIVRLLTTNEHYLAIDWSPAMVAACRERHPEVDVRQGDARDLSELPADHFSLVFFSYNGIDNLSHADRSRVLGEASRLLRPGGLYVYCTFNLLGPVFQQKPWQLGASAGEHWAKTALRCSMHAAARPSRYARTMGNWWRNRGFAEVHDGWGVCTAPAQDFRLIQHFTTVEGECAALAAVGMSPVRAFTSDGKRIERNEESLQSPWLHLVARKAGTSPVVP